MGKVGKVGTVLGERWGRHGARLWAGVGRGAGAKAGEGRRPGACDGARRPGLSVPIRRSAGARGAVAPRDGRFPAARRLAAGARAGADPCVGGADAIRGAEAFARGAAGRDPGAPAVGSATGRRGDWRRIDGRRGDGRRIDAAARRRIDGRPLDGRRIDAASPAPCGRSAGRPRPSALCAVRRRGRRPGLGRGGAARFGRSPVQFAGGTCVVVGDGAGLPASRSRSASCSALSRSLSADGS